MSRQERVTLRLPREKATRDFFRFTSSCEIKKIDERFVDVTASRAWWEREAMDLTHPKYNHRANRFGKQLLDALTIVEV
jgi:hypothetical protein